MRVTVLGAGYMGSAMAKVAHRRGHDVRLWGTWLDDAMLEWAALWKAASSAFSSCRQTTSGF